MAQLHLSAAHFRHISPHMLDNHIHPKKLLLNSRTLRYKETLFILGSLWKRLHRNPNAIKNGTGQHELGITEKSGALHNCTDSLELGFSDNSSAPRNDAGEHELGVDYLEVVQCNEEHGDEGELSSSAMAIALAMQKICGYSVEFAQRVEKVVPAGVFACPSAEFRTLCLEQLSLCANIVGEDAIFSVSIISVFFCSLILQYYGTRQMNFRVKKKGFAWPINRLPCADWVSYGFLVLMQYIVSGFLVLM